MVKPVFFLGEDLLALFFSIFDILSLIAMSLRQGMRYQTKKLCASPSLLTVKWHRQPCAMTNPIFKDMILPRTIILRFRQSFTGRTLLDGVKGNHRCDWPKISKMED